MNRKAFAVLMVIESFFALVSMGLLFSDVGALIYPISMAVFAAVLAPSWLRLKREEAEEEKRQIRRKMALILLIPIAAGVIAFVYVAAILVIGFSRL